jgi:hypothetical protein
LLGEQGEARDEEEEHEEEVPDQGRQSLAIRGHSTALNGNHPQSTYAMSLVADSSTTQSSEVASKSRKYLMREAIREASEGPSE